jgi:hypothetical protein
MVDDCSSPMDYIIMSSSGAVACLDEFNRMSIEVLSVLTHQILTIHTACRHRVLKQQR